MKIIECVPNISEGRDKDVIDAVITEVASVPQVKLLDVDPGTATNRTVITFAGEPEAVAEAAFRLIKKTAGLIDMRTHKGEHPRQGATDVCPFVPIAGVTMEECVELAKWLGRRVGGELNIPVYLYEYAATSSERENLADIRAGEYEALSEKLGKPGWKPDFGPAKWSEHTAKTGATVIGARQFLIAYNINLNTTNVKAAKDIAFTLRERGRIRRDAGGNQVLDKDGNPIYIPGMFRHCKATGWLIPEYNRAQITINLTDFTVTPMHAVFDAACKEAEGFGVRVTGSEIVGMVPKKAILETGVYYLKKQGASTGIPEEDVIKTAIMSLGLNDVTQFDSKKKIIEYQFQEEGMLSKMTVKDFLNELSRNSPAPGGGSVAALAGALSTALASMVASLTYGKKGYEQHNDKMESIGRNAQELKDTLVKAIDEDTEAFNKVMACFGMPKKTDEEKARRAAAIEEATKGATLVPLSVLERAPEALKLAQFVAEYGNRNSLSDAGVAALMARASAHGAYYNVLINLNTLGDKKWAEETRKKADDLLKEVDELADDVEEIVNKVLWKKQL